MMIQEQTFNQANTPQIAPTPQWVEVMFGAQQPAKMLAPVPLVFDWQETPNSLDTKSDEARRAPISTESEGALPVLVPLTPKDALEKLLLEMGARHRAVSRSGSLKAALAATSAKRGSVGHLDTDGASIRVIKLPDYENISSGVILTPVLES